MENFEQKEEQKEEQKNDMNNLNEDFFNVFLGTPQKEELCKAYFGDSYEWYKHLISGGINNGWSWYAFFFGPLYLIYRKCYIMALLSCIVLWFLPTNTNLLLTFVVATSQAKLFPFFVLQRYMRILKKVERSEKDIEEQINIVRKTGGVNYIAYVLGIILHLFAFYFVMNSSVIF